MKFTARFLHKAFPKTHTISLQEAKDRQMFGPVYHGTSADNWDKINTEGFKITEGDTGSAGVRNGYEGTRGLGRNRVIKKRGKMWVNDGKINRMLNEGATPEGWVRGRIGMFLKVNQHE